MLYPSMQQLLVAALCLVIPVAIVLGHLRLNGPIAVCSGAALIAFAVFWLLLGGFDSPAGPVWPMNLLTFSGGALLLLAAWVLALSVATQARHWWWIALLTTAGYLSTVAIVYSISQPNPCIFGPNPELSPGYKMGNVCTAIYPVAYWLVFAGYLAGPAATLAYGLRPDRLSASSLYATSDSASESAG